MHVRQCHPLKRHFAHLQIYPENEFTACNYSFLQATANRTGNAAIPIPLSLIFGCAMFISCLCNCVY